MFAASQQRHQFSAFRLAQLNPVPYIHRLRYISMWSAAMDVGGWLRSLGLGQYEANFRDNKIDADVLPQLTADDLKDICERACLSAQARTGRGPSDFGRAAADHGDVLRSRRLDESRGEAGRRRL